jgi:hypothetical protein
MSVTRLISMLTLLLFLAGCTPVRLYTDSVKKAFDPENQKRWRQQSTPEDKERLCGKSAC